jgi:hypothetical protein
MDINIGLFIITLYLPISPSTSLFFHLDVRTIFMKDRQEKLEKSVLNLKHTMGQWC